LAAISNQIPADLTSTDKNENSENKKIRKNCSWGDKSFVKLNTKLKSKIVDWFLSR
jgi:hypothetical protein